MKILRWVIIQDCSILLGKYKRKHSIFHMFRNIFQSKLFFYYQSKMLIYIESHEYQDSLLTSVERVLSGVKQCISNQTDTIEKQEHMLTKIDDNTIDLKEIIQTDNSNKTIKSNIDEFIHNICNHIGEFGTKMSDSCLRGDANPKKKNETICHTCGYSPNKKHESDISCSKNDVTVVDINIPKVKGKVTNVLEIPTIFKGFLSVIKWHNKLFEKKKFERNTFPLLVGGNKKRLYRLNVVMNLCSNYCDRVGKDKAYDDFFAVFDSAKTRLSII